VTLDTSSVGYSVLTMLLVVVVGYIAQKLNFFPGDTRKRYSDLIIRIGQPFLIVGSITSIEYSSEKLKDGFFVLLLGLATIALAGVIAFFATLWMKNKDERKIAEFGSMFSNCGFMGIPILRAVFGDIGAFWAAFYLIALNLCQWTYGIYIWSRGRDDIKLNLKSILLNYGTVPSAIGILLFVTRVPIPAPVLDSINYVGSLCTPISMLVIGALIATIEPKRLVTNVKIYIFCFIKLFVVPFVVITVCHFVGLSNEMMLFIAVICSLPSPSNVAMFGEKFDILPDFAAHAVGMGTILSTLTVPIMVRYAEFLLSL